MACITSPGLGGAAGCGGGVMTIVGGMFTGRSTGNVTGGKAGRADHRVASDAAHRAHIRFVELVAAGAAQDAQDLWRKHLAAGDSELQAGPDVNSVLDLLE